MFTIVACMKYINSRLLSGDVQLEGGYVINPYDLFMLEQLLKFKKNTSCRIVGLTMGPLACVEVIQRCIAYGLDDIFLVCDKTFSGSDTYATSYILTEALKYIGRADIYAFGEKATDGETGQVSIEVASRLDLLCVMGVHKFWMNSANEILLERKFADRLEELILPIPCALGFRGFTVKEPQINLLKIKKARNYTPNVLTAETLKVKSYYCGNLGSKTAVKETEFIITKRNNEVIEGTSKNKADILKKLISGFGKEKT